VGGKLEMHPLCGCVTDEPTWGEPTDAHRRTDRS
jgi:hypothetical protein